MSQKRILLIGGNFAPEPTGIGKYNGEMMEWLSANGYECSVITTYPYYPYWKVQQPYDKRRFFFSKERLAADNGELTVYRCPHYIPKNPSGLKRIISDFTYTITAFLLVTYFLFKRKHHVVLSVVPPFQLGFLGLMYKWIRGAKLVYHIQDLQIDAARELGMIKSNMLLKMMFGMERFILRKADHVSSISNGMIKRIKAKFERRVLFFPNWVDTVNFFPMENRARLKERYGFVSTDKIVLYSGAIGEKQGLELVLDAAAQDRDASVKYIICGSGPYKEELLKIKDSRGLNNVLFFPLQPKELFNEFLNMADVHLVLQKMNANDLVMPSKLTTILSVGGLALITAPEDSSLREQVSDYNMGILAAPEDLAAFVEGLKLALSEAHQDKRNNARQFAVNQLQLDRVIGKFLVDAEVWESAQAKVIQSQSAVAAPNYMYK